MTNSIVFKIMTKRHLILLIISFFLFSIGIYAQNKHSKITDYPTYDGLVMAGYQGWFWAPKDGIMYPDADKIRIDMWPDVSEYKKTYPTGLKLADGSTARFFSSTDESTVDLHFKWMKEYGIDGVFMQRFYDYTNPGYAREESDKVLKYALAAASKYDRAIAIMYDLSGLRPGEDCSSIIADWKFLVDSLKVTNQPGRKTYLHYRGKPLVVIWGLGFPDRPYDIRDIGIMRLINFLKYDPEYGGCSVMLGVPTYWRDLDKDCVHDNYLHYLIRQADLVMPWMVQRFTPLLYEELPRYRDEILADMKWCEKNNVGYVPDVYPGFSWYNISHHSNDMVQQPVGSIPRQGGKFYWGLLSTAIRSGAKMIYVSMFDEMNEGTAILKCTDNPPVSKDAEFLGLHVPSDTYLWLTGQAAKMLRGEEPLTVTMPERK
jgi:hypothetical protein